MSVASAWTTYRHDRAARALDVVAKAAPETEALRRRLADAQLEPGALTFEDLDRLPVLGKDAVPSLQQADPPFGGLLPRSVVPEHIFASPGPIYEVQPPGRDPWRWGPALRSCGIGPDDIVLNCFSYHLSPAGTMFDEACRSLGAAVVPAGVGATEVQVEVIAALGVTAFVGLPSYLAGLIDTYDAGGHSHNDWRLAKALVTAEPLPDALRTTLTQRVGTVLMAYGTAEVGLIGYEVEPGTGLRLGEDSYIQICDPRSGVPCTEGETGEVVVTVLNERNPVVRFGTGDLSRWQLVDGELRLAGVLGRVGAAVKVRGMFVHPHQAQAVIADLASLGVTGGRFVVGTDGAKDTLTLEVTLDPGADLEEIRSRTDDLTRSRLRVRADVIVVEAAPDVILVDSRE